MENYLQEPCCIARTLPPLLRKQHLVVFQHHGDITFQKLMDAVACMAGSHLQLTVAVRTLTDPICNHIAWYIRREWLQSVTFLTNSEQDTDAMIREQFPDYLAPNGEWQGFSLAQHSDIYEDMIIIRGDEATLVVVGTILGVVYHPRFSYMTAYFGNDEERISMLTASVQPYLHRAIKVVEREADDENELNKPNKANKAKRKNKSA